MLVKHSLRVDDKPTRAGVKKDTHAMVVDASTKGGKSKSGKEKSVICWICIRTRHTSRDCFHNDEGKRAKAKGRQASRRDETDAGLLY